MLKLALRTLGLLFFAASLLAGQSFDVAVIKPSQDLAAQVAGGKMPHVGTKIDAARVDIGFASLRDLICTAYAIKPYQLTGPDWMTSARFDIEATMPAGSNKDQVPAMLQSLLADRFKLTVHQDTEDLSVMALTVGKDGPKLKEALPDADPAAAGAPLGKDEKSIDAGDGTQVRVKTTGGPESSTTTVAGGRNGPMKMTMEGGVMHFEIGKMNMDDFAKALSQFLGGQPVLNKTDLKGNYQVALDMTQDDMMAIARANGVDVPGMPPPSSEPTGGTIYASLDKLGLKLSKEKSPMPMVIVDHIEKLPTSN